VDGPIVNATLPEADKAGGLSALVVDDDEAFRESLAALVSREGHHVRQGSTLAQGRKLLLDAPADVLLVDLVLPDGRGIELLNDEQVAERSAALGRPEVVVITGNATVESAVEALREGALDYLTKPVDRARLQTILTNIARTRELKGEVDSLRGELRKLGRFGRMVGRSGAMQEVYDLICKVAPTQASVFITGESGTGKELVAETIHLLSKRRQRPFLAVNCGAIAKNLIESELFGHEKGSFTGADRSRRGYFEQSNGGTLFLDEVTEMPPELQVKLLRVLETGSMLRVGTSEVVSVDVRVISASNQDTTRTVKDGSLREDLFYRLNVFPIRLPPLRERGDDILLLADHFLGAVNGREGTAKHWSPEARERLRVLSWPGNVRELKNVVERAAILAESSIGPDLLPAADAAPVATPGGAVLQVRIGSSLEEVERRVILATLQQLGGDKRKTAETLGISLKTIYNRLNVYEAAGRPSPEGDPAL
jgi:DNA-binding NtrC family response regulator